MKFVSKKWPAAALLAIAALGARAAFAQTAVMRDHSHAVKCGSLEPDDPSTWRTTFSPPSSKKCCIHTLCHVHRDEVPMILKYIRYDSGCGLAVAARAIRRVTGIQLRAVCESAYMKSLAISPRIS